jgi:2-polyprenyl-3-methyl-5-hydroxy-6-metoxy-1,4-benzoquinol methylase
MDQSKVSQFADKLFADMAGAMGVGMAYAGVKTGLFRAMSGRGPVTAAGLAAATGLQGRYVQEWLLGMAAAGYLEHDSQAGTFTLPEELAYLVASEGTDHYMGGLPLAGVSFLSVAPRVVRAFREGGGVGFDEFPEDSYLALDLMNRGNYEHRLTSQWLEAVPEAAKALESGARALDVGCGAGQVSLNLARAFPRARLWGVDTDAGSVARAQEAAEAEGLAERVTFVAGTVEELPGDLRFELITACDCVHDLAEPERTLARIRERLAPGGTLFVAEPKVADRLEDNRHALGAMFYGFSLFHCMTQSLARGGAGLGACLGPARTEELMRRSGFTHFRRLPIKSRVNLFYEVKP